MEKKHTIDEADIICKQTDFGGLVWAKLGKGRFWPSK